MRNQEQILRLRKQADHFFKRPNEASRRGFIEGLFALSCPSSVSVLQHFVGAVGFWFFFSCLSKTLLRTPRNDPGGALEAALDTEILSPLLFLCQVQPHQDEQETLKSARFTFPQKEFS